MARAGFGGGGDFSGLFGSLYSANKASLQAKQDADDQDAQDRWEHGLMTDGDWLAYIANRITAETEPQRKQRWITAQRAYASAIADKQAEFAYEEGGSINALVAHYEQRLAALTPNSNEYREISLKLNDVQDARSSERLQEQAEALVDQINRGTKTYDDLLKLLKGARDQSTPNSDYRKSVDKQIDQVREQIRVNKLEGSFEKLQYDYDRGALSGGAYAKKLRSMAQQFKHNDPKRYYQILEAAVALGGGGRGGSGGGGGGGGGSRSRSGGGGSSTQKLNKSVDALQAQRNSLLAAVEAYENGATSYVDDAGRRVALTPSYIASVDSQIVSTLDKLATAYTLKKDKSAAANQKKAKAMYVSNAVVKHNTMAADVSSRHLLESTSAQVQDALENPDPVSARSGLSQVASQWEQYAKNLSSTPMFAGQADAPSAAAKANARTPKGDMGRVDTDFVARSTAMASAMRTLTTPGVDDASAAAALQAITVLQGAGGGRTDGGQQDSYLKALLGGVLEVNARVQGLETGDLERVATGGGWEWVRKTEISQMVPDPTNPANMVMVKTKVPTGQTLSGKSLDVDGQNTNYVTILVDINGRPTPVKAVAERVPAAGFDHLKAAKDITLPGGGKIYAGTSLTASQIAQLKKTMTIEEWVASKKVAAAPAFSTWQVNVPAYTDALGKSHPPETWVQDEGTKLWYKGSLPVRGVQRDENGFVIIGDNGLPAIDYKAYASAAGVPAPYAGSNAKAAQDLLNNGVLDVSDIRGRDLNGNLTDDTQNLLQSAYYAPEDRSQDFKGGSWWGPAARQERSAALVERDRKIAVEQRRKDNEALAGTNLLSASLAAADAKARAFQQFANSAGINLNGLPQKKAAEGPKVAGPTLIPTASSGAALRSEINIALPKKPAAPKVTIKARPKPGKSRAQIEREEQRRRDNQALRNTNKAAAAKAAADAKAKAAADAARRAAQQRNQRGQLEY